jgi:hypothetical protein
MEFAAITVSMRFMSIDLPSIVVSPSVKRRSVTVSLRSGRADEESAAGRVIAVASAPPVMRRISSVSSAPS